MNTLTAPLTAKTIRMPASGRFTPEQIYYFFSPLITVLLLNLINPSVYRFSTAEEFIMLLLKIALSAYIVFSVQWLAGSLFKRRIVGVYAVNITLLILSVSCFVKTIVSFSPLLPLDLTMSGNLGDILDFIDIRFSPATLLAIALIAVHLAVYTMLYKKHRGPDGFTKRQWLLKIGIGLLLCAATVYLFGLNYHFKHKLLQAFDVTVSNVYPMEDYENNGFILTFFTHTGDLIPDKPEEYSEVYIKQLQAHSTAYGGDFSPLGAPGEKPVNIIAIQSESWWDPTKMPNITLSKDPMAYIHQLGTQFPAGNLVSPVFGCNTCVPEFEYLTGCSSYFMQSGSYPYIQYVKGSTPSMASILHEKGYRTVALHGFKTEFYNRKNAYGLLGFDRLDGIDEIEQPEYKGTYMSDMEMTRQIIRAYEEKGNAPLFVYGITMQNHGTYLEERYDSYDVDVKSDVLTSEELLGLRTAVQGVYDADQAFEALTNYFAQQDEPVLIVMYGDHFPFLGENSSTYLKTGYMTEEVLTDNKQLFETPYIVWANYDLSQAALPQRISAANLGIKTLRMAAVTDVPAHYKFLNHFYSCYAVLKNGTLCNAQGTYIDPARANQDLLSDYRYIQYDILLGKQYMLENKT